MKIVSLLPSATEIICALGLENQLVGVTHECDYPPSVKALPKVTTTLIPHDASSQEIDLLVRERLAAQAALYSLNMPVLEQLQPDLIVTQALCDVCAVAEAEVRSAACQLPGQPRIVNLEPMTLSEVFGTMRLVGQACGIGDKAEVVIAGLQARVDAVSNRTLAIPEASRPRVGFLEWIDPPFCPGHWNPELITLAGGKDILGQANCPSRTLAWQEVVAAQPEVMFISLCGFDVERSLQDMPILQSYPDYADLPAAQSHQVYVTDGNAYFSRSGPRLVESLEILAHALHPEIHPAPISAPSATQVN